MRYRPPSCGLEACSPTHPGCTPTHPSCNPHAPKLQPPRTQTAARTHPSCNPMCVQVLDDEAEGLTLKLWRMLLFEIKRAEAGI